MSINLVLVNFSKSQEAVGVVKVVELWNSVAPGQSYVRKVAHLTSCNLSKLSGAYSIIQI